MTRILQHLIFPHRNMTVFTSGCQQILRSTHIHPSNAIHMPLQLQLTNSTFRIPHSYTLVIGTRHNPLSGIREQRNRTNVVLGYSVNTAKKKKGKNNAHGGLKTSAPLGNLLRFLLLLILRVLFQVNSHPNVSPYCLCPH